MPNFTQKQHEFIGWWVALMLEKERTKVRTSSKDLLMLRMQNSDLSPEEKGAARVEARRVYRNKKTNA